MPARSWEIDDLAKSSETLKVWVQQLHQQHHLLHSTALSDLPQLPQQHCVQLTRKSHISCTTRHLDNINSGTPCKGTRLIILRFSSQRQEIIPVAVAILLSWTPILFITRKQYIYITCFSFKFMWTSAHSPLPTKATRKNTNLLNYCLNYCSIGTPHVTYISFSIKVYCMSYFQYYPEKRNYKKV